MATVPDYQNNLSSLNDQNDMDEELPSFPGYAPDEDTDDSSNI
jgi:hypothetical protein